MTLRILLQSWCKFWFEPQSTLPIALFRILVGLLLLETTIHWALDWPTFYGMNACIDIKDTAASWLNEPHIDLLLLFPNSLTWRYYVWALHAVGVIGIIFGFWTRFSLFIVWMCLISFQTHCHCNFNASDRYFSLILFLLLISNCNEALSIDGLIKRWRHDWRQTGLAAPYRPGWPQRMLQMQLCVAYCHTFFSKLSGQQWLDGSAIYLSTRFQDFHKIYTPLFLDNLWGCKLLAWGTLFVEAALCSLIWLKEIRYWVLLAGIALHLGIGVTLNIPVFEEIFMATYVLFVDPKHLGACMDKIRAFVQARIRGDLQLAFDSSYEPCIRITGLIQRLDVFKFIQCIDWHNSENRSIFEQPNSLSHTAIGNQEQKLLVRCGETWLPNAKSLAVIAFRLPLLYPLLPVLLFPGIERCLWTWLVGNRETVQPSQTILVGKGTQ